MKPERRKTTPATGRIIKAGRMIVDGKEYYGFFIAATGPDIMAAGNNRLMNKEVIIKENERKG
jgi:hypothetical protein